MKVIPLIETRLSLLWEIDSARCQTFGWSLMAQGRTQASIGRPSLST